MSRAAAFDARLSDLIGEFYDAAAEESRWGGMASRIATALDSTSAVLKLTGGPNRGGGDVQLLDTTENLAVGAREQAWADHWHRHDLWVERSVACGMNRIITSRDLVSPDETAHSAFYQEWLRRLDIHHMVGAVFPAGDGMIGVLGIHRPQAAGYYAAHDRAKVALLLPHLRRALQLGRRLGRVSVAQTSAIEALDRLNAGILVLDRTRRILHANALAERMLRDSPEIGVLSGRLMVRHPDLNARLAAIVRDNAVAGGGPIAARPPGALSVPRDDRLPVTLAITRLRAPGAGAGGRDSLALVLLRDPERPTPMLGQLRDLFGLTSAEAAIAAEIAHGRSLAEIAGTLGVGLSTVRSHLKKILAKTGTSRQAELAALIGRGVAAFFEPD